MTTDSELKQDVQVRGDRVIPQGSVRSYAEKKEAEQAACSAPGICEVENRIAVNP